MSLQSPTELFNKGYLERLGKEVKEKKRSEYTDQIGLFLEKLNPARVAKGYQPLRPVVIATTLSRIGVKPVDMYALYKECERGRDFGKVFWWFVRTKREQRKQLQLLK